MAGAERFGRYRVTGPLGTGAMGEVYAAVDDVLGREVAVKTLRGGASGFAARLLDDRFRQEARAIASLAHPGVVQVFDIDLTAEPPYLVMERVAGPSLKELLADGPLSEVELRALGIQISNALAAAHAAGIVHRDVKPANILAASPRTRASESAVSAERGATTWKLADFGVAHVPDSSLTMTGQFVGSPAYAPPEALVRGQLGPEGDIYGLGATLYEAAAGRWPRVESTTGALFAPVPPLRELAPTLPLEVADAIDRAVAIDADQRPTASELASALARASREITVPLPARSGGTPVPSMSLASPGIPAPGSATSVPGVGPVALPAPQATLSPSGRRKMWALSGAALLVMIVVAVTRNSPSPPNTAVMQAPRAAGDGMLRATPPQGLDEDAAKDWNKIVDKLEKQDWSEARWKLDEWEREYGATPETRQLAAQLDALPPEVMQSGRGRKKNKGRGRGD